MYINIYKDLYLYTCNMSTKIDYLNDDASIPNQTWACVSFITPELVGGKDGKLIGSWIAYHLKTTLNWGLCAALGGILLGIMLIFYWLYNKIVGIDNIKLG